MLPAKLFKWPQVKKHYDETFNHQMDGGSRELKFTETRICTSRYLVLTGTQYLNLECRDTCV